MKRVIILEKLTDQNGVGFRFVLWAAVPALRQVFYVNPDAKSAYVDVTPEELDALRTGQVVEKVDSFALAAGSTIQQVEAALEASWTAFQAAINSATDWQRYGTCWDGTAWTLGSK